MVFYISGATTPVSVPDSTAYGFTTPPPKPNPSQNKIRNTSIKNNISELLPNKLPHLPTDIITTPFILSFHLHN